LEVEVEMVQAKEMEVAWAKEENQVMGSVVMVLVTVAVVPVEQGRVAVAVAVVPVEQGRVAVAVVPVEQGRVAVAVDRQVALAA